MIDFRIQPKDEEDRAYAEGQEARENGAPRSANPYRPDTERGSVGHRLDRRARGPHRGRVEIGQPRCGRHSQHQGA